MTAPPIDIPLDERGAPDLQLLVRLLGSTYLSEPLEHDRHVHRKPSPLWNFGGQIFYEISSAVCLPDYNPQAPFAARPSLGVPIDWRRRVIIVQPRPSYGRSSRRAGPAKPTACCHYGPRRKAEPYRRPANIVFLC